MKALRLSASLTQQDVGDAIGVSQAAYSRLEKGEIEISVMKLFALSELYKLPLPALLDGV